MKRKSTAYRIVQAFILVLIVMLLPTAVWAQETTLTTVVPSSHTLHIELTGEGTIIIDGVAYTKTADISIQRQSRPEITLQIADGYKIKFVLWGREDVTAAFQTGKWTAPEVLEDTELTVEFEGLSDIPQAGDHRLLDFWVLLMLLSAGLFILLLVAQKRRNRCT